MKKYAENMKKEICRKYEEICDEYEGKSGILESPYFKNPGNPRVHPYPIPFNDVMFVKISKTPGLYSYFANTPLLFHPLYMGRRLKNS